MIAITKKALANIEKHFWSYFVVLTLSQLLAYFFFTNVTSTIFDYAMRDAQLSGITNENFSVLFHYPLAIILIIVALISLGFVTMIQMIGIFSISTGKLTLTDLLDILKKFEWKDIPSLLFYTLLILPLSNLGITSIVADNLQIPDFVLEVVVENPILNALYLLAIAGILFLAVRYFYTFLIFFLEPVSFREAMKRSFRYTKGKFFRVVGYLLISVGLVAGAILLGGILYAIYYFLAQALPDYEHLLVSIFATVILFFAIFINEFSTLITLQFTLLSYDKTPEPAGIDRLKPYYKYLNGLVVVALVGFCIFNYYHQVDVSTLKDIKIAAHRGVKDHAIENTVESLKAAKEAGADYVELDVQELADGTLIVMHDPSFSRLSGVNKKVGEVTWDEVEDYTLEANGMTSTIPRFDDYLKIAYEIKQPLLVEIKANNTDSDEFVGNVIAMIEDYNMSDMVIYHSLSKVDILKIKDINPEAYTGYIIGINVGGIENMNVDYYSIDEFSVTGRVVEEIKEYDKGLYEWSVNTEDLIEKAYSIGVEGIITDEVGLAYEVRENLINDPMYRILWWLSS